MRTSSTIERNNGSVSNSLICASLLFLLVLVAGSVRTVAQTLYVTSGGSVTAQNTAVSIAGDATVTSGATPLVGATASIITNFVSAEDRLGINGSTSGTDGSIAYSYNTSTGVLTLSNSATAAEYQTTLRKITYTNISATPTTSSRVITISLNSALPYSGTGHFYEFVTTSYTWSQAQTAAAGRTYFGLQGYLATITSSGENDFCKNKLSVDGWMGASDAAVEGEWKWVTGPEAGTQFWQGLSNGYAVGGNYSNWNTGEPNQAGDEDCGQFYTTGKWNDLSSTATQSGYLVEYGGMAGDPTLHISDNVTVDFPAPANPTGITGNSEVCSGNSTSLTATGVVGTVYWYTGGCGTTQIASGTNPISVSPTNGTTYYARNYRYTQYSAGCASVLVLVNPAPTVADLVATGTGIKWYAAATGGSPLAPSTLLVNGNSYYASQTINGIESTERLQVTVVIGPN